MASSLPDDILIEIFPRLPAKSVVRFRSLSKSWNSCLSTSQFVKLHLVRCKNHPQNLMLIRRALGLDQGCEIRTVSPPITDDVSSDLVFYPPSNSDAAVLGSCHGLVLIHCLGYGMRLINPATREQGVNYIPFPPTMESKEYDIKYVYATSGFGYDSSTDDYKVVVIEAGYYYVEDGNYWRSDPSLALFRVYSVKLGVWTSVTSPYVDLGHLLTHGVFVNGAIHWLVANRNDRGYYAASRILAFSLADEVIHEIPVPPDVLVDPNRCNSLYVLGGCLCVPSCNGNSGFGRINLWEMKEYGSAASWTRFCVNTRNNWVLDAPLCFTDDKEIVFIRGDNVVAMYHFEKETTKEMAVDGDLAVFHKGCTFLESLVSPNQATLVDDR